MTIPIVDRPALLDPIDEAGWPEETSVVIVGGGPAGLSAAIMLAQRDIDVFLLERRGFDARFPRAHLLNVRTMEVFHTIGVADDIYKLGPQDDRWHKVAWYTSVTGSSPVDGVRIGDVPAWGGGADAERYAAASPRKFTNLPQLRLDPLIYAHANAACPGHIRGWQEVIGIDQNADNVIVTFEDRKTGVCRKTRAKYAIVADGGRSSGDLLGVHMEGPKDIRELVSHHVSTDLSMWSEPNALMCFLFHPNGGLHRMGTIQAIGPNAYDRNSQEWLVALPGWMRNEENETVTLDVMRNMLGLPKSHDITLHSESRWTYNGIVAKRWRYGRVFIAGDAAHKHPPTGGLGLNSGVQDVDNLAWKLAAVLKGEASDGLLDSYELERRPTTAYYTAHSLENATRHVPIAEALGLQEDVEKSRHQVEVFLSNTPAGETLRAAVAEAVQQNAQDYSQLNVEAGFHYWAGAFVPDGSPLPADYDSPITFMPTTRPGHHLPHAWLAHTAGASPQKPVSTRDLVHPEGLTLVVDEFGERAWRRAVAELGEAMPVELVVIATTETAWLTVREVGDGGAILVRPDAKVAWRIFELSHDPVVALREAVAIISRGGDAPLNDPAAPYFKRIYAAAKVLLAE